MTASFQSLQTIVGQETYTVWKKMLRELVPDGRTHRLAATSVELGGGAA
jgi:hypothetical protein